MMYPLSAGHDRWASHCWLCAGKCWLNRADEIDAGVIRRRRETDYGWLYLQRATESTRRALRAYVENKALPDGLAEFGARHYALEARRFLAQYREFHGATVAKALP